MNDVDKKNYKAIIKAQKQSITMLNKQLTIEKKKSKVVEKFRGAGKKINQAHALIEKTPAEKLNLIELKCLLNAHELLSEVKEQLR